jgi:glycosyltransferase involved in cell wall biosynthesis
MEKITFCIPSKNNRRYLEACIPSIRKNAYRDDHDIIVFVDEDNDGTTEWLESVKDEYNIRYIENDTDGLYGIGRAYDKCIEESTTDIFMIFHADMMLGKHADLKAFNHLKKKNWVVCSTRIEPPIHPNAGEKILKDFGMWPEEFKEAEFDEYVTAHLGDDKITNGIFAPWMMYKDEFLKIGGHDYMFRSAREDSDVFNRLHLAGFEFIQPWNSLVYHLTGRGGQFQHGKITQEYSQKSEEWQKLMNNSTKEFIRKWGTQVNHTPMMLPIVAPKYNIGFKAMNCNIELLRTLEPWCSKIYLDSGSDYMHDYKKEEQPNSDFDIDEKIKMYGNADLTNYHDIVVEFDCNKLTDHRLFILTNLSTMLKDSGEVGEMEYDIFKLNIKSLQSYEKDLIVYAE